MTIPQLDRLRTHCHRLRLYQLESELPSLLEQAAKREQSYADFLDELFGREVGAKTQKHLAMRVAMARFPFQKTLESFDFKFQPSIDPKIIRELATGRYIESGDNVLLLGPPGVGKTHLAVALGLKACEQGVRTLFTTAAGLIATLGKALAENRLDERLKLLGQPQLLVIDEIGYIPIDRQGANLFFQLVSRRYECGAIILTSNQSLGAWGEVFGDPVIRLRSSIACSTTPSPSTSRATATGSARSSRLASSSRAVLSPSNRLRAGHAVTIPERPAPHWAQEARSPPGALSPYPPPRPSPRPAPITS